ncbi:MAG TPA: thiamine pyrophosphate-binding protein [Acidimicrobiia bacterium]|nr:thiamine pyrophosphate-binding protein [Acidimicrobiia bacterium]
MKVRSGATALVESLVAEGVDTLFGIPGVGTLAVYDAFVDQPALRHIEVRHEQGAVFMADGYARSSGLVGVAFTSGGPGALNTLTAMATAFNDSVPVLHVVNENPAAVRRKGLGHFHDISDQLGVFRPVTGFTQQVALADEIPGAIHQAMFALRNRRPRPAMVEIAGEALTADTGAAILAPATRLPHAPEVGAVLLAAQMLEASQRPVIWTGGGVATVEAAEELRLMTEMLGAPVITTQKGKGGLRSDHPLHIGNWANELPVRQLLASADAMLAVGTRFSYFPTGGWSLRLPERLIQIDVDPAEIGRNYRATVGMVGDAAISLRALRNALEADGFEPRRWQTGAVDDCRRRIFQTIGRPVEIEVLDQIRVALPADALVFNDPTTIAFWARSWWAADRPRTWFVPSGFGTLGYALPAAIGARVARPDRVAIALMGDAGAMFTIQDLMTAVQERIPVIVMVFNDRGYGVERRHQDHLYGRHSGVDILPPDFVALARAFGAKGVLVEDLSQVGTVLQTQLDAAGPVLIEVPNQFRHPGYGSFGNWDTEASTRDPGLFSSSNDENNPQTKRTGQED